jgi:acetyl-CoA synthetase
MIRSCIPAQNKNAVLPSYNEIRRSFRWTDIEKEFSWYGTDRMNIITESIDRWAADPQRRNLPSLIFQKCETLLSISFAELKSLTSKWAHMLAGHGYVSGDRLIILLPPCPEAFLVMAACARMGVIFCPVFSSSTFHELEMRIQSTAPKGLVTLPDLVENISPESASQMEHILLVNGPKPGLFANEVDIEKHVSAMPDDFTPVPLPADAPLYMIYTSGSTRPPKGVIHTHADMTGILASARWALDLHPSSVLWVDADPAWVTGTVYGAFAPWLCGVTSIVQCDPFTAANWYRTLEFHRVTTWYTTPKIIRDLMEAGNDLPSRYRLDCLQHIASVGAPLVPDLFYWISHHLNRYPHDTWWMTETGIICIANYPCMDIKPGSIGKPLPGIEAVILDESGDPLPSLSLGELAIKAPWPGIMSALWQDNARFSLYFKNDQWFVTGDIALQDEDGYFYHHGRNDDLLKTGGNKSIGPFEIEQLLSMHPAVCESAVISKGTEPGSGISTLKAFITLKAGYLPSTRLTYEIKAFLKGNLSTDIQIRDIAVLDKLPKTRSGKLLRRVLRARELGLPGGDALSMQD